MSSFENWCGHLEESHLHLNSYLETFIWSSRNVHMCECLKWTQLTSVCVCVCGPHAAIHLRVFCLVRVCENVSADIQCKHTVSDCTPACVSSVFVCVLCLVCGGFRLSDRSVINSSVRRTKTQLERLKTAKNTFVEDFPLLAVQTAMTRCRCKHVYWCNLTIIIRIKTKYSDRNTKQTYWLGHAVASVSSSH